MTWRMTDHARARIQQRGLRAKEVELILTAGTEIAPGRYCLLQKDVSEQARTDKRGRHTGNRRKARNPSEEVKWLERLVNRIVVAEDDTVITTFMRPRGRLRIDRHRRHAAYHRARRGSRHTFFDGGRS